MSSLKQPWYAVGLRFCGSCLVTLLYWAAWLTLGTTLGLMVYIAVAKEMPVPDFVLRRVEASLAQANLTIKFGRGYFDPTGKILLENVEVRSRQFEQPLLTSRTVFTRRSFWSILAGRPIPDEIRLEGAMLQVPAILSPSGTTEPLVRDLVATLRHEENLWLVDQLAGHFGSVAFTVQGGFGTREHAGAPAASLEEIAGQFLRLGRQLVLQSNQFTVFDNPALAVRLSNQAGVGNTASLLFTASGARQPWAQPVTLGPLAIAATLRLDGTGARMARLHFATRSASYADTCSAENIRAIISTQIDLAKLSLQPAEALVALGTLQADGEPALAPVLRAELARWPDVKVTAGLQIDGEFLSAEVDARLHEQTALLRAEGRASGDVINRVLARHTPRAALFFVFGDPLSFSAETVLAPGWKFEHLSGRVASGRLDSHGVKIDAARGRIDITGPDFLAHDARVLMGENSAQGSYWMNFGTTDYRMLLTGRLRPADINGWFHGDWWLNFWDQHFVFPTVPPEADVDMQGRWRDPARSEYFGRAEAVGPVLLGASFDRVHTLIFLRPDFTHALELHATRGGGSQQLGGWFKRFGDTAPERNRLEFNFDSTLDSEAYARMFPEKTEALLASLQLVQPPHIHAQGSVKGKGPEAAANYTFSGQVDGGLHYYGFPVDSARVSGGVTGADVRLDDIQFALAGGKGTGKAALNGRPEFRRLGFDVYLNGADLVRTIRAAEEYEGRRTGQKTSTVTESKFMKRASGGRLDIALSAQGQPDDLASFTGSGNAALTGTELGEIHLFGLLSQALSGLSLNFSSLKLDAAHTSLRLEGGRLWFPDLKITGPSAAIDGRGNFTFATKALDFTAKFKPFEENHNPLTAIVSAVVTPITSILELKLGGVLSKPEWSVVVGSSGPKAELPKAGDKPAPATPPPEK